MLNQFVLVGRITSDPTIQELEGKKKCVITLAISRGYKNSEGVYDTDFIDVTLWNGIATNTTEYCRKGDIVGVKGRMERLNSNNELRVIAEKVTFVSSGKNKEVDIDD